MVYGGIESTVLIQRNRDVLNRAVIAVGTSNTVVVHTETEPFRADDELGVMLAKKLLIGFVSLAISHWIAPPPKQVSSAAVLASAASGCLLSRGAVIDDPHFVPVAAAQYDFVAFRVVMDAVDVHPIVGRFLSEAGST